MRARSTIVFVTHHSEEALALADVLVVMSMGRVEQVGAPGDILANPSGAAVRAHFTG